MTALTNPQPKGDDRLRVVRGKKSVGRPSLAPWMVVAVLGMAAFLGSGFARTSLDNSAFDLAELNREITLQEGVHLELTLRIARLQSPTRIAPLAEQMGLVLPIHTHQLLADLDGPPPAYAGSGKAGSNQ